MAKPLADEFDAPPPSPSDVRFELERKGAEATGLRQKADHLRIGEEQADADARVADQLLQERQQTLRSIEARDAQLEARAHEILMDGARQSPELNEKLGELNLLRKRLGEYDERDQTVDPDTGRPTPVPDVAVETDPARIAQLRQQLAAAEKELDAFRTPELVAEAARIDAERRDLAAQREDAMKEVDAQRDRADRLAARSEELEKEAVGALEKARGLEGEIKATTARVATIEAEWTAYDAQHPTVVVPGEIVIEIPARNRAQAHIEGRREEAGELEQRANATQHAADDASDGARERLELAALREEQSAELVARAEKTAERVKALDEDLAEARARRNEQVAEAERLDAEAKELRAAGRTAEADVMDARSRTASNEFILGTRDDRLTLERDRAAKAAATDRANATKLENDAKGLRDAATTLRARSDQLEKDAAASRTAAKEQDRIADELGSKLDAGQPFNYDVDDGQGGRLVIEVPAPGPDDPVPARPAAGSVPADDVVGTDVMPAVEPAAPSPVPVPYPTEGVTAPADDDTTPYLQVEMEDVLITSDAGAAVEDPTVVEQFAAIDESTSALTSDPDEELMAPAAEPEPPAET